MSFRMSQFASHIISRRLLPALRVLAIAAFWIAAGGFMLGANCVASPPACDSSACPAPEVAYNNGCVTPSPPGSPCIIGGVCAQSGSTNYACQGATANLVACEPAVGLAGDCSSRPCGFQVGTMAAVKLACVAASCGPFGHDYCKEPGAFGAACDATCNPCQTGLTCVNGLCEKGCSTNLDCPCSANGQPEGQCIGGSCKQCRALQQTCGSEQVCCTAGQSCGKAGVCCLNPGGACTTTSECCNNGGNGNRCISGSCQACRAAGKACTSSGDCCAGTSCKNGVCSVPCPTGSCTVPGLKGICAKGVYRCSATAVTCVQTVFPQPAEVCDGKDDNCDGIIDNITPAPCTGATVSGCQSGFTVNGMTKCVNGKTTCVARRCDPNNANDTNCYCKGCAFANGGHGKPCGLCGATQCLPTDACAPDYACVSAGTSTANCQFQKTCGTALPPACYTPADVKLPPNECYKGP